MKRCGEFEKVAETISWIALPACSFTIDLTGGRAVY